MLLRAVQDRRSAALLSHPRQWRQPLPPPAIPFDADDKSILFLGENNTLYYPKSGATIGAQRGYFKLTGITAGEKADGARTIVLDFGDGETTGIIEAGANSQLSTFNSQLSVWYTLDGLRLASKPTQKGIYINNGKKVVIK